jgi:alpha-glucoside transport system permease protein
VIGQRSWTPWLWLAPALLLLGAFLVYPSVDTIRRSFLEGGTGAFAGVANYRYLVENPRPLSGDVHRGLANNVLWLVLFPLITVPLGLALAVLTERTRYRSLASAALFVPMAISSVASSVIWRFMLDVDSDIGTANAVLTTLGGDPIAWLQDTGAPWVWLTEAGANALPPPFQLNNIVLVMIGVWAWAGFALVVTAAGVKGIPAELLEAARVDGASEWEVFRHIIVPSLRPTLLVVTVTLLINALKIFDLVWVLTGGRFGTDVVATLFFKESFVTRNFGVGAALAVVLLLAVLPLMAINLRRTTVEGAA